MNHKLVVILGKRAAGKSILAEFLVKQFDFIHYEMSTVIKKMRLEAGLDKLRLRKFVTKLHKSESQAFAVDYMLKNNYFIDGNIVITGIRNQSEINFLENNLKNYDKFFIYLKVNIAKRFSRVIKRKERRSLKEFIIEEYYSLKWKDSIIRECSVVIHNNRKFEFVKSRLCQTIFQAN